MRRRTVALSVAGVLLALVAVLVAAVLVLTGTDWGRERVRRLAVSQLNRMAHGRVQIAHLSGNLLTGAKLVGVTITDSAGHPFLSADTIQTSYAAVTFLSRHIVLNDVRFVRPVVVLDRPPGGPWNWARIFPQTVAPSTPGAAPGFGSWIRLTNVRVVDGRITMRSPWAPADTLTPTQRDSVIRVALGPKGRQQIVRAPGGFQRVSDFRNIYATLPLLRISDPGDPRRIFDVAALRMTAEPMRPPDVRVVDLRGRFVMLRDSLYFNGMRAALAGSRLSGSGRYNITTNDLWLRLHADTLSTNDLLWIDPTIPQNGTGKLDFALTWLGPVSDYQATNASLAVAGATLAGKLGIRMADTMSFHDTDLRFAHLDTRTIAQLFPTLRSPEQGYLTGRMAATGGFGAMAVNGDVTFDDPRTGRSRVAAAGIVGATRGVVVARDLHLRLLPVQVALARRFRPTLPIGGTVSGSATVNGSTGSRLAASADLVHQDVTGRSHVIGTVAYARGTPPLVNADLRLEPLSLATVGRFAPAAGLVGSVAGPVRVSGPMRNLLVDAALRTPDGGGLTARGTLDLAAPTKRYDIAASAALFDARSVTTKAPHTMLTLDAGVAGRGTALATMDARAFAKVRASQYDSVAVDSAVVRVAAAGGTLTVDTLDLRVPGGAATAGGTFGLTTGRTGTLRYAVAVDSLDRLARLFPKPAPGAVPPRPGILQQRVTRAQADSARVATATAVERAVTGRPLPRFPVDTPRAIPRSQLAGSVQAAGTLTGNLHDFGAAGTARARDLVAYGSSVQRLHATYAWTNALTPGSRVQVNAAGTGLVAGGFYLDSVAVAGAYRKPDGTVTLAVVQDSARAYAVNARFQLNAARNTLFLDRMQLRFDSTVYASRRPSVLHWGPSGVDVDSLDLRDRIGRGLFVDGRVPTAGSADLTVALTQFDVANIVRLLESNVPAKGLVSVVLHAHGTRAAPVLSGAFGLERFSYAGRPTPEVHGTFAYTAQTLRAALNAQREGQAPILFGQGTVPINLAVATVAGSRIPRNRQIDARIRSDSFPLDLLPQISTSVADVGGRALANFTVRGTVNQPNVNGRVALWNGTARVVPLGIRPTDIAGSVRLVRDTVIVDSLVAHSGGPIRLTGGVGLARSLANPRLALHLTARNALVVDNNQYGHLRVDATLAATGPMDTLRVRGTTRIRQGVLYIPQSSGKTLVGAGDPALFAVLDTSVVTQRNLFPSQSPLLADLRMNVAVTVNRDVFVRSTEANIEVYSDGPIRVRMNRARNSLRIDGVLLTDRGEYQFQSRRFQITQGSATFINEPRLNPTLQATAQYAVQLPGREAFHIQIIISGTLDQPKIALQSDAQPPIAQTDLLSYLAFGRSSTSLLQQEGSTLTSGGTGSNNLVGAGAAFAAKQVSSAALGALTNQFAGQAARSLGADVFTIAPADVSLGASSFLRGTQVEFGKYIQTRTFLGLQLSPDPSGVQRPGITLTHRFPGNAGYQLEASFAPRYLPSQPTLDPNPTPITTSAFGLFLVRQWRY